MKRLSVMFLPLMLVFASCAPAFTSRAGEVVYTPSLPPEVRQILKNVTGASDDAINAVHMAVAIDGAYEQVTPPPGYKPFVENRDAFKLTNSGSMRSVYVSENRDNPRAQIVMAWTAYATSWGTVAVSVSNVDRAALEQSAFAELDKDPYLVKVASGR